MPLIRGNKVLFLGQPTRGGIKWSGDPGILIPELSDRLYLLLQLKYGSAISTKHKNLLPIYIWYRTKQMLTLHTYRTLLARFSASPGEAC